MNGGAKPPSLRVSLYHRLVAGTVLIVLLLPGVLYWHDFNTQLDLRLSADKQEVVLRAYMIDFLLRSTENRAIGLQKLAVGNAPIANHSPYLPGIILQFAKPGQQPLTFDSPVPSDGRGNMFLVHQTPSPGLAREIGIALGLTPMFDVIIHNTPGIVGTYYLSAHQFIYYYPWMPSEQIGFSASMYAAEYYQNAQPERNPQRRILWTHAYLDHSGHGQIVTCAAPVDVEGQFLGVVSIDITLETFHDVLVRHRPKDGTLYLFDADGQALASNREPRSAETAMHTADIFKSASPAQSFHIDVNKAFSDAGIDTHTAFNVTEHAFLLSLPVGDGAWHLVYELPKQEVWLAVLRSYQLDFAIVALCLSASFLFPYWLIGREFVRPGQELVGLLEGKPSSGAVPLRWRPWFERIRGLLGEHDQLTGLQHELDIARNVQRSTLPRQTFQSSELEIAGVMLPAKEVCGDAYDYFPVDERRVAIFVADVSGKGVSAAIYMSGVRMLIRALAPTSANAADCLNQANRLLAADNEEMMFVTLFLGFLDRATGELNYANAGHHPPLLIGSEGKAVRLQGITAPALGPFTGIVYPSQTHWLADGERLLLYTDGVTEAFSLKGGIFGLERLLALLPPDSEGNIAWLERIVASVGIFAEGAGQSDDITCLVARFHAPRLFDLTVPCVVESAVQLGVAVEQWANASGLASGQTQRAAIVLDELFSNAIRHGVEPTQGDGTVWIRLNAWQGQLIGQFRSPEPAFEPVAIAPPDLGLPLEQRAIGGLGLHLVWQLTHSFSWRFIERTNVFDFTIRVQHAEPPQTDRTHLFKLG